MLRILSPMTLTAALAIAVAMGPGASFAAGPDGQPPDVQVKASLSVDSPGWADKRENNRNTDDIAGWGTFAVAHDYLTAGLTLRGPLGTLFDTLRERVARDGAAPGISVTYIYRTSDGEQASLELDSYDELAAFIRARQGIRQALADEIARRGAVSMATAYAARTTGCEGTAMRSGVLNTDKWELDYTLIQTGAPVAVALALADTLTVLTADENAVVLTGPMGPSGVRLAQVDGPCRVDVTPLDRLSQSR